MGLWGADFVHGLISVRWTSTVNAIEVVGFRAKDALVLVDDDTPGIVVANRVTRLLQNNADGTGRNRRDSGAAYRGGYPIRGQLLAIGEDAPQGETSVRARLLALDVEEGVAERDPITRVQAQPRLLAGLMPRFVEWLLATPTVTDRIPTAYDCHCRAIAQRLGTRQVPNSNRIAQDLAMNAVAFDTLVDWLTAAGAIEALAAALQEEYGAAIDHLLAGAARGLQAHNVGELFLGRIDALLAGGNYAIAESTQAARRTAS